MISDTANREALLRMLEFAGKVGELANEYNDLGYGVTSNILQMKAHEVVACAYLPKQYRAPPEAKSDAT